MSYSERRCCQSEQLANRDVKDQCKPLGRHPVVDLDGRWRLDLNASVIRTAAKGRRFKGPAGRAPGHELWRQVGGDT